MEHTKCMLGSESFSSFSIDNSAESKVESKVPKSNESQPEVATQVPLMLARLCDWGESLWT